MKRNRWICICLTALLLCALSAPAFAVLSHEQAQRIQQSWREDKAQQTDATTSATQSVEASYDYKIFVTKEAKREMKKYKTLKQGDKSAAVKKMKERLIDLGYLPDTCDLSKRFDGETKDALYAFQVSNNLTGSDGVAYPYTQYKLFDEYAIPAWGRTYVTLSRGDDGWDVTNLQKRLIDTGYLKDGGADGSYGAGTEDAVYRFQRENGMDADGVAYADLQDILFSPNMNSYEP